MPISITKGVKRFDVGEVSGVERSPQGYLRCDGRITRTGVFTYRDGRGKVRRELRLPDEVFRPDALDSFALAPLTNDHPGEGLTPKNTGKYQVGTIVAPHRDSEFVAARIQITDEKAIDAVMSGKRELSCGYTADLEESPGVTSGIEGVPDGLRYDGIQRNIRGNHVAIVDSGRAGPEASIRLDHADAEMIEDQDPSSIQTLIFDPEKFTEAQVRAWIKENDFEIHKEPDISESSIRIRQTDPGAFQEGSFRTIQLRPGVKAVIGRRKDADEPRATPEGEPAPMTKIKIDGVEYEVSETAAQAIAKHQKSTEEIKAELIEARNAAETERARADKAEEDLEAERKARADAESPEKIRERIDQRLELERAATPILGDEIKLDDLDDAEIKRQVVIATAKDPEGAKAKLEGATDAYLEARYDAAIETAAAAADEPNAGLADLKRAANRRADANGDRRAQMIADLRDQWKEPTQ